MKRFEPRFASHNMNTTFDSQTGAVEFAFYNINLPDSASNEEESHGFLVFDVRPIPGLEMGTIIENTAHIYFDLNPAIVTNTTWHTIFECDESFASFDLDGPTTCINDIISANTQSLYIEDYLWEVNGAIQLDATSEMNYQIPFAQEYDITFTATNPICQQSNTQTIMGFSNPTAEITGDLEYCQDDEVQLTGSGGENYEWVGLGNEQSLSFVAEEDMTIVLQVTDDNGCQNESSAELVVFTLPGDDFDVLDDNVLSAPDGEFYQWYVNGEIIDGATEQTYTASEEGEYSVVVTSEFGCVNTTNSQLVTVISVNDINKDDFILFPNPMIQQARILFENKGEWKVDLYQSDGRLVREYGVITSEYLDVHREDLASGDYVITISNAEFVQQIHLLILD